MRKVDVEAREIAESTAVARRYDSLHGVDEDAPVVVVVIGAKGASGISL